MSKEKILNHRSKRTSTEDRSGEKRVLIPHPMSLSQWTINNKCMLFWILEEI
jgi:hypothetical protein